ncbi:MAG: universal stress protein [Verrucomicrobia bacterium]|nr:universal stress protein [Verrucomicrobiota bacterium]
MKLLVCSDGSERGSTVLALARRIAVAGRAEVTVFGVTGAEVQEDTVYEGLRRTLKEYERNGINVELVTRRGDPVTEIIKKTRETKYDLVMIGTHRKADERAVIPPAKAYAIIEEVDPPVFVAVGDDRPLARILVCTGGGPCIATAVSVTAQLARSLPAAVTLLTVLPNLGGLHASLLMRREADAEALLRSNSALARDLGAEKRSLEASGIEVTVRLRYGLVADEILKELDQGDHDLVVVGACPDPNAWRRYLIGNVTREIVHRADHPILVVRGTQSVPSLVQRIRRAIARMIRDVRGRKP